jgi:hypothetical protein
MLKILYVVANKKLYRQTKGIPMGNPVSPILCMLTIQGLFVKEGLRCKKEIKNMVLFVDDLIFYSRNKIKVLRWVERVAQKVGLSVVDTGNELLRYLELDIRDKGCCYYWNKKIKKTLNYLPLNNYTPYTSSEPIISHLKNIEWKILHYSSSYNYVLNDMVTLQKRINSEYIENLCVALRRKNRYRIKSLTLLK